MLGRALTTSLGLATALALAACGSDEAEPATTPTSTSAEATPTAEPNELRRRFEDEIRAALEAGGQDELVDVGCVVDELRRTLSNNVVSAGARAAERGEEIPPRAVDTAFEAGRACARG